MKDNTNLKVLETLYVGIDVSKNSNQTCILTFDGNKLCNFSSANNTDGAKEMEDKILSLLSKHECKYVKVVLESTGIYSIHIANYLSSSESLVKFETEVYVVNHVTTANYSKVLSIPDKNDPKDAYALAKYIGLIWKEHQSGDFSFDTTRLSKAGNSYLRYYIIEAAGSVILL